MTRLYLDENVQGAITRGLRRLGLDVLTVQEDGLAGLDDPGVLDRATALGRVLFSQDDDLLAEAATRQKVGKPFAGLVFAHQRVSASLCIQSLELIVQAMEPEELHGAVLFLPL